MSFRRAIYSLILYLIFPIVILRLFWRSRSNPAYRQRITERLGFVQIKSKKSVIWVHAVSVGETIAAKPLIEVLISQYPDHTVLVTTTTPTGSDRVKALFGSRVAHVYFPYDLLEIVARFIKRINPNMLIVIETEIWPNLYASCYKHKIPLVLVNARLSERSTQRYLKIRPLVAETLAKISLIAVRSEGDATRFKTLGAVDKQISVLGNIKFDFDLDKTQIEQGKQRRKQLHNNQAVWVVASTHASEDEKILTIYKKLRENFPSLLLVLIPRHPERFDDVYFLCQALEKEGVKTIRHSQAGDYQGVQADIILGDSMGEMQSWFAMADVVFMGGSLVETGGHNPLEATAQGVPVVSGPHMFNFEDIAGQLRDVNLLVKCKSAQEIEVAVADFLERLSGSGFNKKTQAESQKFMQQHQGVTARIMKLLLRFF